MPCLLVLAVFLNFGISAAVRGAEGFRLATFAADVTVPMGHGMMGGAWLARTVADPLEAIGLVVLGGGLPVVYVAVDWCEIRNDAYARWQTVLADSAGTVPERVMISTVHQHDAPVADLEAERLLRARRLSGTVCDLAYHEAAVQRVATSLREALPSARRITHIGWGEAQVERIASNRRYHGPDGTVRFDRMSRTTDAVAVAAPEGLNDPWLHTLSFWDGETPLAAVSSYATHPMSYYGEGEVSADFPGLARRRRQTETPGVRQLYLSGAAGNITAGKYNDGSRANRDRLGDRLYQGMTNAWNVTRRFPLTQLVFRREPVAFEARDGSGFSPEELEAKLTPAQAPFQQCLAAMALSWRKRLQTGQPIAVPCLDFGVVKWLLLPGESYAEFQLAAQRMAPDAFVLVAGYGDGATGYIPTDRHIVEGDGNLSDWSWVAKGSEALLLDAIRRALPPSQTEPWKSNLPIVHVRKELCAKHPRPGAAALVSVFSTGPKSERLEVRALELQDDVPSEPKARLSADHGRTWSEFFSLPPTLSHPGGVEVWEGGGAKFFDPVAGVLVELWLRQITVEGRYHNFTYHRLSRDHGHHWSPPSPLRYEEGEDFDAREPLRATFLQRNHGYFGNNIIRHSNGTLITAVAHANAPGDPENERRPWRLGSLCFIGRWDSAANEYQWTPGRRVEISSEVSSRGLMEPEVAELRDGRVLVVWRGSDTPQTAGRKWFSVSADGGLTLSPPQELRYDDGSRFYSPSSIHRMIRHSVTGKLYWLGNLCASPPRANSPRYPLVIAEVDESTPALRRSTITAIDDRQPGVPEGLQLSNFSLLEHPETHELELWLTRYGDDATNVFSADSYKYTLWLRPEPQRSTTAERASAAKPDAPRMPDTSSPPGRGGAPGVERELIRDPSFQGGFLLLEPKPGARVVYGTLAGSMPGRQPIWDLAQWSSKYPVDPKRLEVLPTGVRRYADAAKRVAAGDPGADAADLTLAVTGSIEYAGRARRAGEPWVHLLVQQDIHEPPSVGGLAQLKFHIEARLLHAKKIETPDYSPDLHAAQFQVFLSVQNRNPISAGHGQYLWFGIPLYDDRHRIPVGHVAQDTGGTAMFIYTPSGEVFNRQSPHEGQWITVDTDLLPLIRQGLDAAWERGFLKDSHALADYQVAGINLGWEVPGLFDVGMQVRGLSLRSR